MDLYSLVFYAPALQTVVTAMAVTGLSENSPLTHGSGSSSAMVQQLCSLMSDLLHTQPDSPYVVAPHALLYNFMPSDKGKQKKLLQHLWLAAALVPWRHSTYDVGRRKIPVVENIIREGLRVSYSLFATSFLSVMKFGARSSRLTICNVFLPSTQLRMLYPCPAWISSASQVKRWR
jgi:hypothetical protein